MDLSRLEARPSKLGGIMQRAFVNLSDGRGVANLPLRTKMDRLRRPDQHNHRHPDEDD